MMRRSEQKQNALHFLRRLIVVELALDRAYAADLAAHTVRTVQEGNEVGVVGDRDLRYPSLVQQVNELG